MRWVWIDTAVVLAIHEENLAEHGGQPGMCDEGLLVSALARPGNKAAYDPDSDAATLAAAYAFGIAGNHPFIDGNKRIGHAAMEVFLVLNGHQIEASVDEQEQVVLQLASGALDRDTMTRWLVQHVRPRSEQSSET